jgi:hypothetical protein
MIGTICRHRLSTPVTPEYNSIEFNRTARFFVEGIPMHAQRKFGSAPQEVPPDIDRELVLELAMRLLKDWPIAYRARSALEILALRGASLAREAVADQGIRDALAASSWEANIEILRKTQERRLTMP